MGITSFLKAVGEKVGLYEGPSQAAGPGEAPEAFHPWGGVSLGARPPGRAERAAASPEPEPHETPFSGETVQAAVDYCHQRQQERADRLKNARRSPARSIYYTVQPGDNLHKIAESHYGPGQGEKNHLIYEANKPILTSPEQVYPGQVLRIPSLS